MTLFSIAKRAAEAEDEYRGGRRSSTRRNRRNRGGVPLYASGVQLPFRGEFRYSVLMGTLEDDGRCPVCGGELTFGYGFAGGGGIGPYTFCLDCDRMITKQVDVPGESFVWAPGDDPAESE